MKNRKRLILHGYLKDLYDGDFVVYVDSAAEALEAFNSQTKALSVKLGQDRHQICLVGFDTREKLFGSTDQEDINLIPRFSGNKSGFLSILIGAAIIIASSYIPGAPEFLASLKIGETGLTALQIVQGIGVSLALGGVFQLLAPAPSVDQEQDPEASKFLGSTKNTVKIGTRIPVAYGEVKIGGHILSFNVDTNDLAKGTFS